MGEYVFVFIDGEGNTFGGNERLQFDDQAAAETDAANKLLNYSYEWRVEVYFVTNGLLKFVTSFRHG